MSAPAAEPAGPIPSTPAPSLPRYRLWLHGLAILLVLGTFVLVGVGGNVTSWGAGLAVPDWPGTFGYNMFLAPIDVWVRDADTGQFFHGQFWEHSHRLIGAAVGMVTIGLAAALWVTQRSRPWLQWAGLTLLGAIIVQGLMGGFRVTEVSTFLAALHGIFGQVVLAATVLIAAAVGRVWLWSEASATPATPAGPRAGSFRWELPVLLALPLVGLLGSVLLGRGEHPDLIVWRFTTVGLLWVAVMGVFMAICLWRLASAAMRAWRASGARWRGPQLAAGLLWAALFVQLILGAAVRHAGADRAIPDAPLVYGGVVAPLSEASLERAIDRLPPQLQASLPETGLGAVWLHYTHRLWALGVTALVIVTVVAVFRSRRHDLATLFPPTLLVLALTFFQIMLGVMTVWSSTYPTMATLHQATGAALLAFVTWLVIRSHLAEDAGPLTAGETSGYNPTPAPRPALQGQPA